MSIKTRIYEDYTKKSRLSKYKEMLETAKAAGYRMIGVRDYYELLQKTNNHPGEKILLVRHDIDTSPKVARKIFEIEKSVYGNRGTSTFYFRWTTIDTKLIKDIEDYGYETGYHYEELAAYIKDRKLKDREQVIQELSAVRRKFLSGLEKYRQVTRTASETVASHGDFVNTKLDIQSFEILKDDDTRKKANIILEAYDASIMDFIDERFADHVLVDKMTEEVCKSISKGTEKIMILIHPRNWEVDIVSNTKENFRRLIQGIMYR